MKTTPIVPGCIHLNTGDTAVLFGSPPEILKFLSLKGFSIPEAIVLPDAAHVHGVSQMALEFPAYYHLFFRTDRTERRRIRVIGTAAMCARARDIVQITLVGPSRAMLKSWNVSKTRTAMLCDMMDHLAIKLDGSPLMIDDIFEFAIMPDNDCAEIDIDPSGDLRLIHTGFNRFAVQRADERVEIDMNFSGDQLPLWKQLDERAELPQVFRIKLLGTYSGFDTDGPTTGVVMWINGNAFLVDGPAGTAGYLRRVGITKSDLCGVILSHVHDDHCTLIDMILSEQKPNIITTREIFESMLIKVSRVIGITEDELRRYVTFTEVLAGKPIQMWGARWEFFYTVHSIPTVGFRVSVANPADGTLKTFLHSSDTAGFRLLDEMLEAGAITAAHHGRMKSLVRGDEALAMIDGGGPPIHGDPADYADVMQQFPDTEFVFYHVNPSAVDQSRFPVATPGFSRTFIPDHTMPGSLIFKLLKTMKLLEVAEDFWINVLLSQGELMEIGPDTEVVSQGQPGDSFYFILSGSAQVLDKRGPDPVEIALLEGGDFFGEMSIIRGEERNAAVRTLACTALFRLPGDLFLQFVEANSLKEKFEHMWLSRSVISRVRIFRNLHPGAKHRISMMATRAVFHKNEYVFRQGSTSDDFYIITRGTARVVRREGGQRLRTVEELQTGDFFGENVAMGYRIRRNASVLVTSDTLETMKLSGKNLRAMADKAPIMCHELHLVMKERGMTDIPLFASNGEDKT